MLLTVREPYKPKNIQISPDLITTRRNTRTRRRERKDSPDLGTRQAAKQEITGSRRNNM